MRRVTPQMGKPSANGNASAGYSGKPLWQKLGLKPGLCVTVVNAPTDYWTLCGYDPVALTLASARAHVDFAHVFTQTRAQLGKQLTSIAKRLEPGASLWISWPKKRSGVASDLTEDVLREVALPLGLVDVKVCAVDATWSGLKFMWRKNARVHS
jgi:hypothetical protein